MTLFDTPTVRVAAARRLRRDLVPRLRPQGDRADGRRRRSWMRSRRSAAIRVELTGAGRTDAGVHAWGQVVSCDLPRRDRSGGPADAASAGCAGPGRDPLGAVAEPDFDARFSAIWRHYRYTVLNDAATEPVPGVDGLARRCTARRAGDAARVRSPDRRARLHLVLPATEAVGGRPRRRRSPPGASSARWDAVATTDDGCCGSRSGPPRSAIRWCDRSSGRSSTWVSGAAGRATPGHTAGQGSLADQPGGAPARPVPVGGRLSGHHVVTRIIAGDVCRLPFHPRILSRFPAAAFPAPGGSEGSCDAYVLPEGQRDPARLARDRRRRHDPRSAVHRSGTHPAGQAQADLRSPHRHRRPRHRRQRLQDRAHLGQGRPPAWCTATRATRAA